MAAIEGDDYIDMEVSSFSNNYFLRHSNSSSSISREFEFQMSSSIVEDHITESLASPADELFYKGKLLPLHLPPRLQMVEKLLQNNNNTKAFDVDDEFYSTPLATTKPTPTTTTSNTPFESCQVSRELSPDEYAFEFDDYSIITDHVSDENNENNNNSNNNNKKSWTKKLLQKKSSIGSTIKASRAYFRSLFGKSGGCAYETYYAASTKVADESSASISKANAKDGKKIPFGQIQRTYKEKNYGTGSSSNRHRRSFSVGLKLISGNNKPTSSSSLAPSSATSSSSFSMNHLKRCSSVSSERENSIQGAIAHCKKSHTGSDVGTGFYSFSASRISVCDDHDRAGLCRG